MSRNLSSPKGLEIPSSIYEGPSAEEEVFFCYTHPGVPASGTLLQLHLTTSEPVFWIPTRDDFGTSSSQYWCGLINITESLWSSGLILLGYRTSLDSFLFEPQHGKPSHPHLKTSSHGKIYHNFCTFFQWLIMVTARNKKKKASCF